MRHGRLVRGVAGVAATGIGGVLFLAACGGGDGEDVTSSPGFEECVEDPLECNSGPVQDSGEITWIINANADGWMVDRTGSNSVYGVQAVQGIHPSAVTALPDGGFEHSSALLAEAPELTSEAPQAWTYRIREEAVWSDGTPITADDFRFTWQLGTGDEFGECIGCLPPSTARTHQVDSIVGSDDGKTVTVTLREGEQNPEWEYSFFLRIYPAHLAREAGFDLDDPEDVGRASEWLNETVPTWSGGPWQIVEGDLDVSVIKEPNPMWYGEPVNLEQVTLMYNSNEGSWVPGLQTGEIDGGAPSATWPEDVIRQLDDLDGVLVGMQSEAGWEHLDINMDNTWLGGDVNLRRAIFTAVDTGELAQRLFGELFPEIQTSGHPIFRTVQEDYVDLVAETDYGTGDIELAQQILADAGYEVVDGVLTMDGEQVGPFRLRATNTTDRSDSLQFIQATLAELGIEIVIEHTDQLGTMLQTQDYDIAQFGWSGALGFATAAFQYGHSDSGNNFGRYRNPEYDQLADAAINALTLDESAELSHQAARLMLEDAYVLPMYERPILIFARDEYFNIRDNAFSSARAAYESYQTWGVAATE